MTANNRSLLLLRAYTNRFLDLAELDFLVNKPAFHLIEALTARKSHIKICPLADSRDARCNQVSTRLKSIERNEKSVFEESGAKNLMLGYPFISGQFSDGTLVRCPLLFFPVEIFREKNFWHLRFAADEHISFNKSFLLAYSHFNKTPLSDELYDTDFSDFDKDITKFLTRLYHFLEENGLECHFNPENFEQEIHIFQAFSREDFVHQTEIGKLKLRPNAVLGLFPQSGSYLEPDYDLLISRSENPDIENIFLTSNETQNISETLITPFEIDASQEAVMQEVKSGKSLVVQGPPGTGKSQLICNLIADALANDKRVLVVCQKRAALDVVAERLKKIGLDDFAALVHDFRTDRNAVCLKIEKLIEKTEEFKKINESLDNKISGIQFEKAEKQLNETLAELKLFRKALFDDSLCGLPVKELYLTSSPKENYAILGDEFLNIRFPDFSELLTQFGFFLAYAPAIDRPAYPLVKRNSFQNVDFSQKTDVKNAFFALKNSAERIRKEAEKLGIKHIQTQKINNFFAEREKIYQIIGELDSAVAFEAFSLLQLNEKPQKTQFDKLRKKINNYFDEGTEITLMRDDLPEYTEITAKAVEKLTKGKLFFIFWTIFESKKAQKLSKLLQKNDLSKNLPDVLFLKEKLALRKAAEETRDELCTFHWLCHIPDIREGEKAFQMWEEDMLKAWTAAQSFRKTVLSELPVHHAKENFTEDFERINAFFRCIEEEKNLWNKFWTDDLLNDCFAQNIDFEQFEFFLEKDFDRICEFDRLKDSFSPPQKAIILKIKEHVGTWKGDETRLLDNSFRLAWIAHIEKIYPVLRAVATEKMAQMQNLLADSVYTMRHYACVNVLTHTRMRTYRDVRTNRLGNAVNYRELLHQVKKKRNTWALRKILANFTDEVFSLMPCWLSSPETVSAVFAPERLFDLVIFDEASQCFAERGLPSVYRGKQTLIVGDDKQLQPNDLYSPRYENEEEDAVLPELEVLSLLDLGKQFLPQRSLKGHYRSRSLALIDFSNRHFYQNELQLVPDYFDFINPQPPVVFVKSEGIWENGCNPKEAQNTADLVMRLIETGKNNIGVITFNYKQQNLITDILEQKLSSLPEEIFVKNIENVQGDERDIIIFSVGYAPDLSGKLRLHFGSLNTSGGENRLNVAVTRAREQIFVVSSIYPAQLNTENTQNQGPKLLKAYLEFALCVHEGKFSRENILKKNSPKNRSEIQRTIMQVKKYLGEGLQCRHDVAFADGIVYRGEQPQEVLLTDDEFLENEENLKEYFVYKRVLLREKNWTFRQFWARKIWAGE